jgi:hypothetical protein
MQSSNKNHPIQETQLWLSRNWVSLWRKSPARIIGATMRPGRKQGLEPVVWKRQKCKKGSGKAAIKKSKPKQKIQPRQIGLPKGELTFCEEKLDAGAVCILHDWSNESDECSRPI